MQHDKRSLFISIESNQRSLTIETTDRETKAD